MVINNINKLSIIIPCYNEQSTLELIVNEVLSAPTGNTDKEIIIVDDCSIDTSADILRNLAKKNPKIKTIFQQTNQGKGAALQQGFKISTGDVVIVQDADREYDPRDYNKMLDIFREDRADIVFGSRFSSGSPRRVAYLSNTIANKIMTRLSAILSGLYVSDIHTCYIMFDGDWIRDVTPQLKSKRFGFNPEIVAKIGKSKSRLRVCEVGISYYSRTKAEGKKIGIMDGIEALWLIFKFNIFK